MLYELRASAAREFFEGDWANRCASLVPYAAAEFEHAIVAHVDAVVLVAERAPDVDVISATEERHGASVPVAGSAGCLVSITVRWSSADTSKTWVAVPVDMDVEASAKS
jgi:hypothetical protein